MNVWACVNCGVRYRIHIRRCPRCRGEQFEETSFMPKITVHGGASNAAAEPPATPAVAVAAAAVEPVGGEPSSPGTSSSTSPRKPRKNAAPRPLNSPSPVPTTESPSEPDPTEGFTAPSTDGEQTDPVTGPEVVF